jgi:hypothetical protein
MKLPSPGVPESETVLTYGRRKKETRVTTAEQIIRSHCQMDFKISAVIGCAVLAEVSRSWHLNRANNTTNHVGHTRVKYTLVVPGHFLTLTRALVDERVPSAYCERLRLCMLAFKNNDFTMTNNQPFHGHHLSITLKL